MRPPVCPYALMATYIGGIPHLRGHRAMVTHRDPYRRPWWNGREVRFAQFNDTTVQRRLGKDGFAGRSVRKFLGYGWHAFPASAWRFDPVIY